MPRNNYSQWRQKECYRWLKIQVRSFVGVYVCVCATGCDACSQQDETGAELACKVYANTQWATFSANLIEGSVIFLKEFRVHSITPTGKLRDRLVCVKIDLVLRA